MIGWSLVAGLVSVCFVAMEWRRRKVFEAAYLAALEQVLYELKFERWAARYQSEDAAIFSKAIDCVEKLKTEVGE